MDMRLEINAKGHKNITARHRTTLEITKDDEVGPNGDCIVAVSANVGLADLDDAQRKELRESRIKISFFCKGHEWSVHGTGSDGLAMTDPDEMVIRKSHYECGRTLMVGADRASFDMPKILVECLMDPNNDITVFIETLGPRDSKRSHRNTHI
jgi:hypothetical protein